MEEKRGKGSMHIEARGQFSPPRGGGGCRCGSKHLYLLSHVTVPKVEAVRCTLCVKKAVTKL